MQRPDVQMLVLVAKQFAILFFLLLTIDTIIDLLFDAIDMVIDLGSSMIDLVQTWISVLLIEGFDLPEQQSDSIIGNSTLVVGIYLLIRFLWSIPRRYVRAKRNYLAGRLKSKRRWAYHWKYSSVFQKVILVSFIALNVAGFFFLLTLLI